MPPLLSLQRDLCFVEVIEGETDDLQRQNSDSSLLDRLGRCGVLLQSIEINAAGCFVIVKCADIERLKDVVRSYNVAIRVRDRCGRIRLRRGGRWAFLPSLASVLAALHHESIRIVHFLADAAEVVILVDARQVASAMAIMGSFSKTNAQCSA